jgi:hypothetical protein
MAECTFVSTKTNNAMTTHRLRDNSFKGVVLASLFIVLSFKSCIVAAQSSRQVLDKIYHEKAKTLEDSIKKLNPRKFPRFIGGELSLTHSQYSLKSKIPQLSSMTVGFLGTNVGGMWGNAMGKIKANGGMYYSDANVPYNIDMIQASCSSNIYFLRIKKLKYHTLEPYASIGFSFQKNTYRGNYLATAQNNTPVETNYSSSDSPILGRTSHGIMNTALGVEFQLESESNVFIHLFAEVGYGVALVSSSSRKEFKGTAPVNLTSFSLGINFGILK